MGFPARVAGFLGLLTLLGAASAGALILSGPPAQLQGSPGDVEVVGGIAYVATSAGLEIFDARDPQSGYTPLATFAGNFAAVEIRGPLAYLVGSAGLRIVDVSDAAHPLEVGAIATPTPGFDIALAGDLAYVAQNPLGLRIFDVSDPTAPAELGAMDLGPSYSFFQRASIAVDNGVAYLSSNAGGASVDVANPSAPALITLLDIGSHAGSGLAVRAGVLYAAAESFTQGLVLRVLDVRNPATAVQLSSISCGFCKAIELVGGIAYAVGHDELQLFDVSDPSHPAALAGIASQDPLLLGAAVSVTAGRAYVVNTGIALTTPGTLQAVDVRVPEFPKRSVLTPYSYYDAIDIAEHRLYGVRSGGSGTFDVFDLSDPQSAVLVGQTTVSGFIRDLEVVGQTAYIAADGSFQIIDVSEPANPVLSSTLARSITESPRVLAHAGSRLYMGTPTGIEIDDISDPIHPLMLGSLTLTTASGTYDLDLAGDLLYVSTLSGLYVVDVSDPTAPKKIGSFAGIYRSAALSGNLLYLAGSRPVQIVDVSDPTHPTGVGAFAPNQSGATDVEALGTRLFVANGLLNVFDISQPTAPVRLGGRAAGSKVIVSEGLAYASWDFSSPVYAPVYVIDFGPEYAPTLEVAIDVDPLDPQNRVDPMSRAPLTVGLFGSPDLDVRKVDRTSLAFGPAGARSLFSLPLYLNRDRRPDLASLFRISETGIAFGDTQACLTGRTDEGRRLHGCGAIQTVQGCGRGHELALLVPILLPLGRALRRRRAA